MDALDFFKPREGYVLTGSYRETRKSPPQYFEYSIVDYQNKTYSDIINNLIATREGLVIRTLWDCGFKDRGYVSTQDGLLWEITQVQIDMKNSETLRLFASAPSTEFILALIRVENVKGII
jgi:hypothetical protein